MQRIKLLLIVLMIVSVGFLSGCAEEQKEIESKDIKAKITVINHFSGEIEGCIQVEAHGENDSFDASQTVTVKSGDTKIFWFDTPDSLYNTNFYPTFTATYVYDPNISKTIDAGCYLNGGFQATFIINGSPPNINIEHHPS